LKRLEKKKLYIDENEMEKDIIYWFHFLFHSCHAAR
jgi:hypothetical protein